MKLERSVIIGTKAFLLVQLAGLYAVMVIDDFIKFVKENGDLLDGKSAIPKSINTSLKEGLEAFSLELCPYLNEYVVTSFSGQDLDGDQNSGLDDIFKRLN